VCLECLTIKLREIQIPPIGHISYIYIYYIARKSLDKGACRDREREKASERVDANESFFVQSIYIYYIVSPPLKLTV